MHSQFLIFINKQDDRVNMLLSVSLRHSSSAVLAAGLVPVLSLPETRHLPYSVIFDKPVFVGRIEFLICMLIE